ncbi:MAG: hypothetical protein M0P47_11740 [Bacteroidales bacterium]|nr:hypothetical protein [Bacteroidales bacterium]
MNDFFENRVSNNSIMPLAVESYLRKNGERYLPLTTVSSTRNNANRAFNLMDRKGNDKIICLKKSDIKSDPGAISSYNRSK